MSRGKALVVAGAAVVVALKAFLLFVAIPQLSSESASTAYVAHSFQDWHDYIPANLVAGNGYRFFPETTETMLRTPGYVLVLAGVFSIFGHSLAAAKAFNLLFSLATTAVIFALGKQITSSNRLGLVAAAITLFHPAILISDSRGGPDSLLALSIAVFVLLVYRSLRTEAIRDYVLAGIAFGVLVVIKPTPALFPAFLFLYLLGLRPSLERARYAAVRVGALALAGGVVLSPWIVRNYALSGHFVPTMTVGGMAAFQNFYVATHRHTGKEHYVLLDESAVEMDSIAKEMGLKFRPGYYPQFYTIADEVKYYGHLGEIVRNRYVEDPFLLLDAAGFQARGFWIQGRTAKATTLNVVLVLPFLALALWGTYVGYRRSLLVGPMIVFIGAFFLPHVFIAGTARYHVPIIPLLAVLACITLGAREPTPSLSKREEPAP